LPEIICNTSPLPYLHQLGKLDLLRSLVGRIIVPAAVQEELDTGRKLGIDLPDVTALDWVTVSRPVSVAALPLVSELGPGETEVLMLALESPGAVVVLDDSLARYIAETNGIKLTGTLGILRDAKRAGIVSAIRPLLDRLQELGFRLAPQTRNAILRQVGEIV
jgi:predicted nucleic acid-binding protein